ncbi:MAG: hypothetical protein IT381_25310 [Deltaproteobacteria bacterium]|nr:hypothetical protein [Deltaproteobacteria bacterium]
MHFLIRAACVALYPRTETLPGVIDTDIDGFLRRFRKESNGLLWLGLVAGTLIFTATPLITVFLPLPSFLLPRRLLDKHADRIASHRVYLLRQAIVVVKMAAGLCWGAHPKVRAAFALPPYPDEPSRWRTT